MRRLHIRAEAEDEVPRAATLLTDALHTASLPAERGRLVVIQHLALGRISSRVSPASLALHIERVTQAAMAGAVEYDLDDLPGAARANAVSFPDRGEAIVALARAHARGEPTHQWFWNAVVPGWHECPSPEERWVLLLEAAHELPERAIVAARAVDRATEAGVEDQILSPLRPAKAARWLQVEGWGCRDPAPGEPSAPPLSPRRAAIIDRWQRRWDPADVRFVWLATMWAVRDAPARAADPGLPAKVAALLVRTSEERPRESARPRASRERHVEPHVTPSTAPAASRTIRDLANDAAPSLARSVQPLSTISTLDDARAGTTDARSTRQPDVYDSSVAVGHQPEQAQRDVASRISTRYAGLLFVIPILQRLGFGQFVAAHPALLDIDLPARLLWFIGRSAGMKHDDPLAEVFEPSSIERDWLCASWTLAVRRWCRRHAGMSISTLIRRPGRIYATRTHLESYFTLPQLDVGLRRVALDVDPGWVSWIGRVVQFHYGERDDCSS